MKQALVRVDLESSEELIMRLTTCIILGADEGSSIKEWLFALARIMWVALVMPISQTEGIYLVKRTSQVP